MLLVLFLYSIFFCALLLFLYEIHTMNDNEQIEQIQTNFVFFSKINQKWN